MPTRTETWTEDVARQMLTWLDPAHLADPEQARILAGYARINAAQLLPVYNRAIQIGDMLDTSRIPGRILPHLAATRGLDERIGFRRFLADAQLRRFTADAPLVWRDVGIDLRRLLVALLGRPVMVADYHSRKAQAAVSALPWYGLPAPSTSPWPEYTTDVHLADPWGMHVGLGGSLTGRRKAANRELAHAAIEALRAINERVDVAWMAFLDDFTQGLFQWAELLTPNGTAEIVDRELVVSDRRVHGMATGAETLWRRLRWDSLVTFDTDGQHLFYIRATAATDCAVIRVTASGTGGLVEYIRTVGGAPATVASAALPIYTAERYHVRIDVVDGPTAGFDDLQVFVDGALVIAATGTDGIHDAAVGPCAFGPGTSQTLRVAYTEVALNGYDSSGDPLEETMRIGNS